MNIEFRLIRYRYSLTIKPGYRGAMRRALKPLPGESWLRGNDLADGDRLLPVLLDILLSEFGCSKRDRYWRKLVSGMRDA